ncbi:MAG: CHAT domain-containing protein, partial [Acidobacteria bacterium]|nr:CHAT domain-containing protein [Acidobacteriota bacterium]
RLWQPASGKALHTLTGHRNWVLSVAWSPNGQLLASASDTTVRLWQAASGKALHTLTGHRNWVLSVAWSPDGQLLASGSDDRTVRLWQAASGKALHSLTGHQHSVRSVAWSPDGQLLASGSDDKTVRLWHAASGREKRIFEGHSGPVIRLQWDRQSRHLASASEREVIVWDAQTGAKFAEFPSPFYRDVLVGLAFNLPGANWDSGAIRIAALRPGSGPAEQTTLVISDAFVIGVSNVGETWLARRPVLEAAPSPPTRAINASLPRPERSPPSFESVLLEASPARKIVVTGHRPATGEAVESFEPATPYALRFRVSANADGNLASGEIDMTNVPPGSLDAQWVATSSSVEFLSVTPVGKVERNGEGWMATFSLRIPGEGDSETVTLNVKTMATEGEIALTLFVSGEQYRKAVVKLGLGSSVADDVVCIAPGHLGLGSTHEWTTPPVHIEINVFHKKAIVTTVRGTEEFEPSEWTASRATLDNPIKRVRAALEKFRAKAEMHLNHIDPADMEQRLRGFGWQMYHSWQPMRDEADDAHRQAMAALTAQPELRVLAVEGYRLFDTCFPAGSGLRTLLENLTPGSRVNFVWTNDMAVDWVSHVPWALMYLDSLKATETPNCERFLGLRLRIGSKAWEPKAPSRALGDPAQVNLLHFLYWGNNPRDEVAVASSWQRSEFAKWARQNFVPDLPGAADPKQQVVAALETPAPSPVGVLYLYCHCSVKDGSEPQLQFGESAQASDVVDAGEIYTGRLEASPLVFANACTTASADPQGSSELEQRFFARGIRAFIGTETKVPVKLASHFAWLFFQFFLRRVDPKPMPAGEALAQARMFLWTQYRNPGGLFYCLVNQYNLYLASHKEVSELQRS